MADSSRTRHDPASKRRRRFPYDRLALIAAAAPAATQAIMFAVMAVDGRWLFAMMTVPGLIGCLASMMMSVSRRRADDGAMPTADTDRRGTDMSDGTGREGLADFMSVDCPAWETLALPAPAEEPILWRHIVRAWLSETGMEALLGVGTDGRPFRLDLTRHGPHALVAGTTGSGKSVLLQTWCMALACRNPPDRLNFVFLDFKGGSAFNRLARLPHVVGNVCDLDLAHATRALASLEHELRRRERLVAEHHAGDIDQLDSPPARLMIVVDEFHALRSQLPDYVDRLVRIAALGRSLGMHLVACTQNPSGQVSADMKANIAVNICLRVRDAMQSTELLGSSLAASIGPATPGAAYCADGESLHPFICALVRDIDALADAVCAAQRFHGLPAATQLFSPPLPRSVPLPQSETADMPGARIGMGTGRIAVPFGLADNGVTLDTAVLRLGAGNVAIIGQHGRGKTMLLAVTEHMLRSVDGVALRCSRQSGRRMVTRTVSCGTATGVPPPFSAPPPAPAHAVWLVDDADMLLDPLGMDDSHADFHRALQDAATTVIFAVRSSRHVRVPEHCTTRIVFPTGDRSADLMDGIPPDVLARLAHDDLDTPGRAVLLEKGRAMPVQCFLLQSVGETP